MAKTNNYKPRSNYHNGKKERNCYFCNCGPPLREHHVIPQRFDGPDTRDNIVEVCDLCHKRLERLYDKSFYEWFGIEDETGKREFHRPCWYATVTYGPDCNNQAELKVDLHKLAGQKTGSRLLCHNCTVEEAKKYKYRIKRNLEHPPREFSDNRILNIVDIVNNAIIEQTDRYTESGTEQ